MSRAARRASNAQRRAELSRFKRLASGGYVSSLVSADDVRLRGDKLLSSAISQYRQRAVALNAKCFACSMKFGPNGVGAAAFLCVQPAAAPATVSTSALCAECWTNKSDEEIQHQATRALKPVLGGAAP